MTDLKSDFRIFRTFKNSDQLDEMQALLNSNGVISEVVENRFEVDITFVGGSPFEYQLLIQYKDFEKANSLLRLNALNTINTLPEDYYLFSFTDEELVDIIRKPEDWNDLDQVLAEQLIQERGVQYDQEELAEEQEQRKQELEEGEDASTNFIVFAYIFSIAGSLYGAFTMNPWFLGASLIGIFMGFILWRHKKTLTNGKQVWAYNEVSRKQGKNIFWIGAGFFAVSVVMTAWFLLSAAHAYSNCYWQFNW